MRKRTGLLAAVVVALVATLPSAGIGVAAQPARLRVLASNGVKSALEALQSQAERAAGGPVTIAFATSASTRQRIVDGEAFDVAILTTDVLDDLAKTGKVVASSRAALGKSGIGVGSRAGTPKPDITTADALKHTLLGARGLTWASDGASRPHIEAMLGMLGIVDAVKSKIAMEQGSVRSAGRVASGESDLVITLISEILPIQGVELAGPLPDEFQHYVSFGAAVGAQASNADAARAFVAFLAGADARPTFTSKGIAKP